MERQKSRAARVIEASVIIPVGAVIGAVAYDNSKDPSGGALFGPKSPQKVVHEDKGMLPDGHVSKVINMPSHDETGRIMESIRPR